MRRETELTTESSVDQQVDTRFLQALKQDPDLFASFLNNHSDKAINYVLKKLGRLPNNNSQNPLLSLINHPNDDIRALAIKNLAKIANSDLLPIYSRIASSDTSSTVRRESVSAIGRMRCSEAIPILTAFLDDADPKVVMQAIRGLLFFASRPEIKKVLQRYINHPNELVQEMLRKELGIMPKTFKATEAHDQCAPFLKNIVVHGDVQEILEHVPTESIHLTFTSPPYYNARDYSIYQSYQEYLLFLEDVFRKVHRITKEGRYLVLNTSPIIIPRISRAHSSKRYPIPYDIHPKLVQMGWEFIDDIVWVKPEASVKNRNAGFLQHRKPLAYKPNAITEMLMVYRKKTDKLIDWNIRQYSREKVMHSRVTEDYETTNLWRIDPTFDKVHSAVFPLELCRRVIKFYSMVDDIVFDPFAGSGTLAVAANTMKRYFFLTEKEHRYIARIRENITTRTTLFDVGQPRFLDIEHFKHHQKIEK